MNAAILIVLFSQALAESDVQQQAVGAALMQSRLRGTKSTVPSPMEDYEEVSVSPKKELFVGQQYSDDDETCSAEGITPGICALASLAKLAVDPTSQGEADCDEKESRERLERALIAEIESAITGNHSGIDPARLKELEDELRPTYATLPHEQGASSGLGLAKARYLLHQHFLRQHSWYVRGLDPAGDGRKPPNEKEALRSRVAGHLLEILETKAGQRGLDLKMLAVFVATLEHLLQGDQHERLKQAWAVHGLQSEQHADAAKVSSVLEVFMAHHIYVSTKSESGYAFDLAEARKEVKTIAKIYTGWPQILEFIAQQVQRPRSQTRGAQSFSFEDAVAAADAVLLQFSKVSGSMCRDMEHDFSKLPGGSRGRVSLADMRSAGDLFRETDEYLRELGALDESLAEPYVFLPNYMLGPSNCDGTTSFYDLCCPNECEAHKSHMERALAVTTSDIAASVLAKSAQERLASALPKSAKWQLESLARAGPLQLHGKDFAYWLHQVFPSQCPMPRESDFNDDSTVPDAKKDFQATTEVLFDW